MRTNRVISVCLLAFTLAAGSAACTAHAPATRGRPATSAATVSPAPATGASTAANGYSFGYGTYYVATRRKVPPNWGNAKAWYACARRDGYSVGDTPKKGAIAWTDRGPYGQVAIVESVSSDGAQVKISEMNGKDGWNRVTTRNAPASSFRYIY